MSNTSSYQSRVKTLRRFLSAVMIFVMLILAGPATAQRILGNASPTLSFQREVQDKDNPRVVANTLVDEAKELITKGTTDSFESALKKLTQAISIWREIGDRQSEAITLSYIGKVYSFLSETLLSLDYYDQALTILRDVADAEGEARTLSNIGLVYDARGEKRKALEFYNLALPILRNIKDKNSEGVTLVNIGLAYDGLGEKQKALTNYLQALSIFRATKKQDSEAVTLNNLGLLYDSLGEKDKALDYYEKAFPIFTLIGNKRLEAVTLNNIGYLYDSQGNKQKALDNYKQALPVLRASGDRIKEAVTINNIGLVYHSLGQFDKALDYFTQALTLRQSIGDRPGVAVTHSDIGMVYVALGQPQNGLKSYNDSLRISREVEDYKTEALTLRRMAIFEESIGNLPGALVKIEAALSIIEDLRTKITGQDLRASYFASVHEYFETYIALLMRMHLSDPSKGFDAQALKASERARARSMLEMLTEAKADIREGVTPHLLGKVNFIQRVIREKAEKQTRLIAERKDPQQVAALRKMIDSLLVDYQQAEAEIRMVSPRYAALTQPVPLSVKEIQQQALDKDTVLLEYSLGEKKSFLWAVTSTTIKSFELAPRAEIETASRLVYELLTARNKQVKFETAGEKTERVEKADKDYFQAAARLSAMLLGPVASQLGKKRLLIVGDGAIDYIPFAALPSPRNQVTAIYQPLIVDHEVVSLPSATTLALLRREMAGRRIAEKTLAVIADPVFDKDDARVNQAVNDKKSQSRTLAGTNGEPTIDESDSADPVTNNLRPSQVGERIQRLPFTRLEADAILALVPSNESKRAVDFEANRDVATSPELGKYRFVHFATHGILNSQYPELSGIVLSLVNRDGRDQDGLLQAHEVFNLHLPVEMVVLSGCRTGLGKEIRGEGLVGLTRGFMYAGARRVVVSLWDVSDEASAELMTQFYKAMLGKERLKPAAALRSAQVAVLKDQRWRAPYYWAAFIIQGEAN